MCSATASPCVDNKPSRKHITIPAEEQHSHWEQHSQQQHNTYSPLLHHLQVGQGRSANCLANPCAFVGRLQGRVDPCHVWPTHAASTEHAPNQPPNQMQATAEWQWYLYTDCVRRSERLGTPSSCDVARRSRGCSVTALTASDVVEGNAKASSVRLGASKLSSASRRTCSGSENGEQRSKRQYKVPPKLITRERCVRVGTYLRKQAGWQQTRLQDNHTRRSPRSNLRRREWPHTGIVRSHRSHGAAGQPSHQGAHARWTRYV